MPSGKIHDGIAVISVFPVFLAGNYIFHFVPLQVYIYVFVAFFTQLMFGPDLDINSSQYKRWGIFRWIWIPYMKISGHRSRLSHGIFFGSIFRCIYFIFMIILAFYLISVVVEYTLGKHVLDFITIKMNYAVKNVIFSDIVPFILPTIAGIFTGAAIHTITDKISSFFKNLI